MYLIVRNTDDVVVAITGRMDRVATTENGDTVTVEPHLATAAYDAVAGVFYRFRPAYPGDIPHRVVEVEEVPDGMTAGRCKWVEGALVAYDPPPTTEELVNTMLGVDNHG